MKNIKNILLNKLKYNVFLPKKMIAICYSKKKHIFAVSNY